MSRRKFFFILILLLIPVVPAQELDITPQLKKIEAGDKDEVQKTIPSLKKNYPNSSSVMYLDALLTEDGEKAFQLYKAVVDKLPKSKYADDAVYRMFAYSYAIDELEKSETYRTQLKTDYPESPYNKLTEKVVFVDASKVKVKTEENKHIRQNEEKTNLKDYKFTVQAGAFARKENAIQLKSDFDKAGYSSQLIEKSIGGSLFHVVHVGKFKTDEEAKSFLTLINSKFKLQGWIVKLD